METTFRSFPTLSGCALAGGDSGWCWPAVAGLRGTYAVFHTAGEELRQLLRSEMKEATERRSDVKW